VYSKALGLHLAHSAVYMLAVRIISTLGFYGTYSFCLLGHPQALGMGFSAQAHLVAGAPEFPRPLLGG
jgi:uncharacterized membrane protein